MDLSLESKTPPKSCIKNGTVTSGQATGQAGHQQSANTDEEQHVYIRRGPGIIARVHRRYVPESTLARLSSSNRLVSRTDYLSNSGTVSNSRSPKPLEPSESKSSAVTLSLTPISQGQVANPISSTNGQISIQFTGSSHPPSK